MDKIRDTGFCSQETASRNSLNVQAVLDLDSFSVKDDWGKLLGKKRATALLSPRHHALLFPGMPTHGSVLNLSRPIQPLLSSTFPHPRQLLLSQNRDGLIDYLCSLEENNQNIHKNRNFCFWPGCITWDWIHLSSLNNWALAKICGKLFTDSRLKEAGDVRSLRQGTTEASPMVNPGNSLVACSKWQCSERKPQNSGSYWVKGTENRVHGGRGRWNFIRKVPGMKDLYKSSRKPYELCLSLLLSIKVHTCQVNLITLGKSKWGSTR